MNITHVGPSLSSFPADDPMHSSSGRMLSLTVSADGSRLYAGSFAGVWRSDDGGRTWRQMVRPQPASFDEDVPSALDAQHVFDLVVSPADPNLVLASGANSRFVAGRNGIYRSTDGAASWVLVHRLVPTSDDFVSQIVFAPDDPRLAYAAIGSAVVVSTNAGLTWRRRLVGGTAWHVAVAPLEAPGKRRVYAAGNGRIFCSLNGGTTWASDPGAALVRNGSFAGPTARNSADGAQVIAVEPRRPTRLYLAAVGGANGPSYYATRPGFDIPDGTICNTIPERGCGEGSLWHGDFDQFETTGRGQWSQLPGPPVYFGLTTPSGNSFVVAKQTSSGFLLFFADESHVHVAVGKPTGAASWHRLDGKDASLTFQENNLRNQVFVHPDPHALVVTSDFDITLRPPDGVTFPFDQNSILDQHLAGTIWMANDGGVHWSEDGGQSWHLAAGLETLDPINIAGLFGTGSTPALYMGTGDNRAFFSPNGGQTWKKTFTNCGDCDAWFADVAQPRRVIDFEPGGDGLRMFTGGPYPDATDRNQRKAVPPPQASNAVSDFVIRGFRPVIATLATELPMPDGDYVFIGSRSDGARVLFRTTTISTITKMQDWENPAKGRQIGPVLPANVDIVQASGGHASPVFYVGDAAGNLFRLDDGGGQWIMIVPGGPPGQTASKANRFFVNPFHPAVVYVLDDSAVKVSLDKGVSWRVNDPLTRVVTAGGRLTLSPETAMTDMLFGRGEGLTSFVLGHAGVSCTVDGTDWRTILSSIAMPGLAESGFFDAVSNPFDRALYVSLEGRSVLRLSPVPAPRANPNPVFDLLELAAILADA